MDSSERRTRIRANLGIEAISHGQIYTFQIAIPKPEDLEIPLERRENLERSLTQQGSNLIPLIVRRTEAYSEEEEYEVVYGADLCLVAKELDIEKLWVWVFDMTDEQAAAAKEEMQQLLGSSNYDEKTGGKETDINSLLEQKLKPISAKLNQLISNPSSSTEKSNNDQKLKAIETKLENLLSAFEKLTALVEEVLPPKKLNLLTAGDEQINSILEEAGTKTNQRKAALEAIKYWQKSGRVLSWGNLDKSTKSGEHKIKNFAEGTYDKLKEKFKIS
ncbi:MAG: hypothetical protein ACR2LR_27055 [Hassallia sp.]